MGVMDDGYVGMIIAFAGNYAPAGWALCDGSLLPIKGHEMLYTLIGTTYGGDGSGNFALPNLMRRVAVGGGQGLGLTRRLLGQSGGAGEVTLTVNQLPAHTHPFKVSNAVGKQTSPTRGCTLSALDQANVNFYNNLDGATLTSLNTAAVSTAAGGGAPHTNLMPYEEITYLIHLTGTYPQFS
jgi:microcystin-dependent protein